MILGRGQTANDDDIYDQSLLFETYKMVARNAARQVLMVGDIKDQGRDTIHL